MQQKNHEKRYLSFNAHLRERFGERVYKVTIDAGFTCPNRDGTRGIGGCIYCYGDRSAPQFIEKAVMLERMRQGMRSQQRKYKARKFLAYFQSYTNTYAPVEQLEEYYRTALAEDYIVGMTLGTRPDCVDEPTLDMLERIAGDSYLWVEYGVQSLHSDTLARINRGHTVEEFFDAVERTKRRKNIHICAHVILGLPGEQKNDMLETARMLSKLDVDGVKIHSVHVLQGTALEEMYRRGEFAPLEFPEYLEIVCDFLEQLAPEIIIHRLVADGPHRLYLAPQWCLNKSYVLEQITMELERRGTFQGSRTE